MKKKTNNINNRTTFIGVRLDDVEWGKLQGFMDNMNIRSKSNFFRSCLFNRKIFVRKYDPSLNETIIKLTQILALYRNVGVNYNQVVKQLNTCFSPNKAAQLISKLDARTVELVKLSEEVQKITYFLQDKYTELHDECHEYELSSEASPEELQFQQLVQGELQQQQAELELAKRLVDG
jgi:hypothetical protein